MPSNGPSQGRTTVFAVLLILTAGLAGGIIAACAGLRTSNDTSASGPSPTPTPVTPAGYFTWKNNNQRTGLQANETTLTPANVNASQFGQQFTDPLDGWAFAQPLYVTGLTIGGAQHNVVFVATEHASVYAFDADKAGPPLWHTNFLGPGITTVQTASNPDIPVHPEVGITGTPVIDPNSNTIYVLAQTVEHGIFTNKLHALDITTGAEKPGSPVVLSAPGFQDQQEFVRCALLLANGNVYVAFASYGDIEPYKGFMFAFNASTLVNIATWNVTPSGDAGGIWMGAAGPAADASGNIFVAVGNGTWDGANNFGQSVVKLDPSLHILDFFAPFNANALNVGDHDLGSGGVVLVPDQAGAFPHELLLCGKNDPIFVLNRDNLGRKNDDDNTQIIQSVVGQLGGSGLQDADHCFMSPAFFQQTAYFVGNNDVIKAFSLDPATGKLSAAPTSQGTFTYAFPGGQPVVSASGTSNGIVWVVSIAGGSTLHAYDASNMAKEIYVSPAFGQAPKFAVPTVINGKVYVTTKTNLVVFGLNQ